jgi:hypothetical protein
MTMTDQAQAAIPFSLVPFDAKASGSQDPDGLLPTAQITISGSISIATGQLEVTYRLQGELDRLEIPPAAAAPQRRDLLWQTTCLELFLARQGADDYWEFNVSPAGHWNVYHLEGYRQGLQAEPDYRELPVQLSRSPQELILTLRCPLPPDLQRDRSASLEVGITAVVEGADGSIGYWALLHPSREADFHDRGGFCINIP